MPTLSVIMPAYNEEGAIGASVSDVCDHVLALVPDAEFLVVDDGSRDRTGQILDGLAQGERRVRVIHQANTGHGGALRRGLDEARGTWLFLLDSDRQIPLEEFAGLWDAARAGDGAFGVRSGRDDPLLRLVLTRVVRLVVRLLFGTPWPDLNVPFKVVRRGLWEAAAPAIPRGALAPSLFLAIAAHRLGARIACVPVAHRRRATGVVSIRRWKLVKFCWRGLGQLLAFRRAVVSLAPPGTVTS